MSVPHFKFRNSDGFTLLEVMVALSVVAIGFLGVYNLFTQSLSASESARFHQQASALAAVKIAEWQKGDAASADDGDFGVSYLGWRWRVSRKKVVNKEHEALVKRLNRIQLEIFREGSAQRYQVTQYLQVDPT